MAAQAPLPFSTARKTRCRRITQRLEIEHRREAIKACVISSVIVLCFKIPDSGNGRRMAGVATKDLVPGMRLARPVLNKSGLPILGEDTELTQAIIDKIQEMDIQSVNIKGISRTLAPREEVLAQLDRRFKNVEGKPYMDVLKRLLVEHIEELYAEHRSKNP